MKTLSDLCLKGWSIASDGLAVEIFQGLVDRTLGYWGALQQFYAFFHVFHGFGAEVRFLFVVSDATEVKVALSDGVVGFLVHG